MAQNNTHHPLKVSQVLHQHKSILHCLTIHHSKAELEQYYFEPEDCFLNCQETISHTATSACRLRYSAPAVEVHVPSTRFGSWYGALSASQAFEHANRIWINNCVESILAAVLEIYQSNFPKVSCWENVQYSRQFTLSMRLQQCFVLLHSQVCLYSTQFVFANTEHLRCLHTHEIHSRFSVISKTFSEEYSDQQRNGIIVADSPGFFRPPECSQLEHLLDGQISSDPLATYSIGSLDPPSPMGFQL